MPSKYGAVAKVLAVTDASQTTIQSQQTSTQQEINTPKPNAINLYVLGYNQNKKITTLNSLVKSNLQQYLSQYRMLTDQVNILDAFIVNIGVNFDITVYKNYNIQDVLAVCLGAIKEYFDSTKWNINQPIRLGDLALLIQAQDGVQSVNFVEIVNKYFFKDGRDYQPYRYDITDATVDGIVYPSLDPCIFEVRYPEDDIVGSARQ
jgi:phage-related baseplate assembly protein